MHTIRCALSLLPVLALALPPLPGQGRRPLTHDDCGSWPSILDRALSHDGGLVAFSVTRSEGDGTLVVRRRDGKEIYRHPRGRGPRFTKDGRWLVFAIDPTWEKKREERRKRSSGAHRHGRR